MKCPPPFAWHCLTLPGALLIGAFSLQPLQAQPPQANAKSSATNATDETPSDGSALITSSTEQVGRTARSVGTRAISTITGEGTAGNIAKFTGPNQIGNSVIFESAGNIGIGTVTPGSKLTVISGGATTIQGDNTSTAANAYGIHGRITYSASGANSAGVRGTNNGSGVNGYGVFGSHAGSGSGVYGYAASGNGVWGRSVNGKGVYGLHSATSGTEPGVLGETNSTATGATGVKGVVTFFEAGNDSAGVRGINQNTLSGGSGVYGAHAGNGSGVYGFATTGVGVSGNSESNFGVFGDTNSGTGVGGRSASGIGIRGTHSNTTGTAPGVLGETNSTTFGASGVQGVISALAPSVNSAGVRGVNQGTGFAGYGVSGTHVNDGIGVSGSSTGGIGVEGFSSSGSGIYGSTTSGLAGEFDGNVQVRGDLDVTGTLTKGAGTFKIDHPLDPANKYLSHSFVESPDMMNIYNGNVTLDKKGQAIVKMPDYFSALNREFRYQLTAVGAPGPNLYVAQEITSNQFKVAGGKPGMKVSWMVTGVRKDAYANANRVVAVEEKKGGERGAYLHPQLFGQPKEKAIGYAQSPNATKTKPGKLAQRTTAQPIKK
jgi:hypothetical protein